MEGKTIKDIDIYPETGFVEQILERTPDGGYRRYKPRTKEIPYQDELLDMDEINKSKDSAPDKNPVIANHFDPS